MDHFWTTWILQTMIELFGPVLHTLIVWKPEDMHRALIVTPNAERKGKEWLIIKSCSSRNSSSTLSSTTSTDETFGSHLNLLHPSSR